MPEYSDVFSVQGVLQLPGVIHPILTSLYSICTVMFVQYLYCFVITVLYCHHCTVSLLYSYLQYLYCTVIYSVCTVIILQYLYCHHCTVYVVYCHQSTLHVLCCHYCTVHLWFLFKGVSSPLSHLTSLPVWCQVYLPCCISGHVHALDHYYSRVLLYQAL